ncbi:sym-1 [Periconia macrospinosa]|uniref:Sym-1 n=1 Tax=Periconia macrospinosa TaxID=97972 RepID=A0A2V1DU30_9PLEO|nr:sym-1 [Periconia macrospinosa]
MFRWYQRKLASHPTLTQAVATTVLFGTGDILAQQFVEKKGLRNHEFARTGRMAFYGGAIWRPVASRWFKFLQTRIVFQNKNVEMVTRVAIDQTTFAPMSLCVFLSSMSIMEGSNPKEKLEKSYFTALKRNWTVWPFVQLVNFRWVPLDHRIIVVQVVSLGWNCYLSYINSTALPSSPGGVEDRID